MASWWRQQVTWHILMCAVGLTDYWNKAITAHKGNMHEFCPKICRNTKKKEDAGCNTWLIIQTTVFKTWNTTSHCFKTVLTRKYFPVGMDTHLLRYRYRLHKILKNKKHNAWRVSIGCLNQKTHIILLTPFNTTDSFVSAYLK